MAQGYVIDPFTLRQPRGEVTCGTPPEHHIDGDRTIKSEGPKGSPVFKAFSEAPDEPLCFLWVDALGCAVADSLFDGNRINMTQSGHRLPADSRVSVTSTTGTPCAPAIAALMPVSPKVTPFTLISETVTPFMV